MDRRPDGNAIDPRGCSAAQNEPCRESCTKVLFLRSDLPRAGDGGHAPLSAVAPRWQIGSEQNPATGLSQSVVAGKQLDQSFQRLSDVLADKRAHGHYTGVRDPEDAGQSANCQTACKQPDVERSVANK